MIGMSFCPTLGIGTPTIGEHATSPSSTSQPKNRNNALYSFKAVPADRDSTIQA
jgi:hypothetical protein